MSKDYVAPVGEGIHLVRTGDWRTRRPVLDASKCKRCGICLMFCPVNSISRERDGSFVTLREFCKGCGICAAECPHGAMSMEREVRQ